MPESGPYHRHDWVYPSDDWLLRPSAPLPAPQIEAVRRWCGGGRPLIVARRRDGDAPGLLSLGLALPGKTRIAIALPIDAVARRAASPLLLDLFEIGMAFWPEAMHELGRVMSVRAAEMRLFGSFAWQFFAADPALVYVTRESDIDLLMAPKSGAELTGWIAALQDFERRWPAPRLDGEIALPGGDFLSWREFAARPRQILVKGADHLRLCPIDEIDWRLAAMAA